MAPEYYDQSTHCTCIGGCIPYHHTKMLQRWVPSSVLNGGVPGLLQKKIFLTGGRDPFTVLWRLPINHTAMRP